MKHIIWDYNGTLLWDLEPSVDADNHVFRTLGLPLIDAAVYRRYLTMPVRNFYEALGVNLTEHPYAEIARIWWEYYSEHALDGGLTPGTLEGLTALREAGRTQSILSACHEPDLLSQCETLGLVPFMTAITGHRDRDGSEKTELARHHFLKLGIPAGSAVFIGDMVTDYELAKAMGCECILVSWGHNSEERLRACGAPVVSSMQELLSLLSDPLYA